MVKPTDTPRPVRRARPAAALALALAVVFAPISGCGMVPKARVDECHRVAQTLRAENDRLRDVALDLRAQNQDLSQRAVDDGRRLAAEQEARERLESSVQAYQSERDALAAAFESLKRQIQTAVRPLSSARTARLKAFAAAHPGWSFDAESETVSAPADRLFTASGDLLTSEAVAALDALASELSSSLDDAGPTSIEVVPPALNPPAVVRAEYQPAQHRRPAAAADLLAASARFQAAARATKIRDQLALSGAFGRDSLRLAPPFQGAGSDSDNSEPLYQIRLVAPRAARRGAAALDARPGIGR